MATSKYTIHVPTHDEQGSPLRVHEAVHRHLIGAGHPHPTVQLGYPHHGVSTWAEESPEMDSQMKQLGVHAGEVCNVPTVQVTREGDKNAVWLMHNPMYSQGFGAEMAAINLPNSGILQNPTRPDSRLPA